MGMLTGSSNPYYAPNALAEGLLLAANGIGKGLEGYGQGLAAQQALAQRQREMEIANAFRQEQLAAAQRSSQLEVLKMLQPKMEYRDGQWYSVSPDGSISTMGDRYVKPESPQKPITEKIDGPQGPGVYLLDPNTGEPTKKIGGIPKTKEEQDQAGPFRGTGADPQSMNIVLGLASKIKDGTATEQEKMLYNIASAYLSRPRITGDMETGLVAAPRIDVSGSLGVEDGAGGKPQKIMEPQGREKPLSAGEAGKTQAVVDGLRFANDIGQALFNGGSFNRGVAAQMMNPFSDSRALYDKMANAIDAVTRARTGAALNKQEMDQYMDLFMPKPWDSEARAANRIEMLQSYFQGTLDLTQIKGVASEKPSNGSIVKFDAEGNMVK